MAVPFEIMRQKVRAALDDPRAGIPADEVFARLERKHLERMKAAGRDA
ncbi:antitoxin PaaA2 family protein [Mesorhizobium sp. L-8-3]